MSIVHVVFCMDTEGPCDDPGNSEILKNWEAVDEAMDKLFKENFRNKILDSFNGNLKFGWFFLTWSGFNNKRNPRKRDLGYHKIYDHYRSRWGKLIQTFGDEECWHYHHPPRSGVVNEWSTDWNSSQEYKSIISRQIIERNWFPICFRAGGTIMDKNLSQWVDKWFPFDYSNRAPLDVSVMDWSDGIDEWKAYNPDPEFFKKEGNGKRYLARTMDLVTGSYTAGKVDIEKAFMEAENQGHAILSTFDHDYRDIEHRFVDFISTLNEVSKKFPNVQWKYSNPSNAIIETQSLQKNNNLKITTEKKDDYFSIKTNLDIHQENPWIAAQRTDGAIFQLESNIEKVGKNLWRLSLDQASDFKKLGIAASNNSGDSFTKILTLAN